MSERDDERLRIRVSPEPTDEEMAAIAAAVTALASQGGPGEPPRERGGGQERWARTGRRELLRPFERNEKP